MSRFITFLALSFTFFLNGCATELVQKAPTLTVSGMITSISATNTVTPEMLSFPGVSVFTTEDAEVVANVVLQNVSGEHSLVWEWYDPSGKVYVKSQALPVSVPADKFYRTMTFWHRLPIRDEKAALLTGEWKVRLLLDGDAKLVSKFMLNKEIEELNVDAPLKNVAVPRPNYWALVVGVENYASLPTADYAAHDAVTVSDYFIKVLGVPENHMIVLKDAKATRSQIEGFLKNYLPKNVGSNSVLFVYFSGHGLPDLETGEPYIMPYDADTRFISTSGYKLKSLYSDLSALRIKQSFVLIDSCFSGSSRSSKMIVAGIRPALLHVDKEVKPEGNIVAMTSSTGDQVSNAYGEKRHGLFTYFLLNGLRGKADNNSDGYISVNELYSYVRDEVTKTARRSKNLVQTPLLNKGIGTEKIDDFILTSTVQ